MWGILLAPPELVDTLTLQGDAHKPLAEARGPQISGLVSSPAKLVSA
jgi:hypothetical protein